MSSSLTAPRGISHRMGDWLPVLLYVSLIFALSAQPRLQAPIEWQNSDKLWHLLEYGGLGWLMTRAIRNTTGERLPVVASLIAVVVGMSLAGADEWFQSTVPGRDSSALDWFADTTGLTLAGIVQLTFARDRWRGAR